MLAATGVLGLFVKMLTSLALILAIIAIAYAVMRRRSHLAAAGNSRGAGSRGAGSRGAGAQLLRAVRRSGDVAGSSGPRRRARRSGRSQIEVLGRVGLTRSTAAVALRFGDRVVLVGASEQAQPTVLAELDLATWELYDQDAEWRVPDASAIDAAAERSDDAGAAPVGAVAHRPLGFLDALREATVRRG